MRRSAWGLAIAALALSLGLAACGGSGGKSTPSTGGGANATSSPEATASAQGTPKQGGKLTVLWSGDVDHIDCGETYYQMGLFICFSTQRPLYSYKPDDGTTMVPDLASGPPEVSADRKTVTVHIRDDVRYSPPYGKLVTSADVKYAIERGFFDSVSSGFTQTYFSDLVGAKIGAKPGTTIPGIETPNATTIVFKLTRATGGVLAAGALGYVNSAPVPKAYAAKYDDKAQSDYGMHQLATGPYMIAQDASGNQTGYKPNQDILLVRNPSWKRATDYKPAYLDEIDNKEGNSDDEVASRQILTGQSMINGDWAPPPDVIQSALRQYKSQIVFVPGAGNRYVAMNTTIKPFDDINVRKAVSAAFDRVAMRQTRGGPPVGDIATHYIMPGVAGFEQAGGMKGDDLDFLSSSGEPNMAAATKYMKAAGYPSGKYSGPPILMVGSNEGVQKQTAEVAQQQFEKLGFKVTLRLVNTNTMYTKFCNTPSAKVAVCPNVGWIRDFSDGQPVLDPTFNGKNILEQGNSNWPQLNDPKINAQMAKAELLPAPQRPAAWGEIDREVTSLAVGVPWLWDKQPSIESSNVNGVVDDFTYVFSLPWTSLK